MIIVSFCPYSIFAIYLLLLLFIIAIYKLFIAIYLNYNHNQPLNNGLKAKVD